MRRTLVGLFVAVAADVLSAQRQQQAAVAEWVRSTAIPLQTVQAGDLRSREAFDVTLFIDMTTAARSNPR